MAGPVVCVVGAGTGGLEGLLRARRVLGPGAELRLIAPEREFRYRPMDARAPFSPAQERGIGIAELAGHAGAEWVQGHAVSVSEADREVLTRDGDTIGFDHLLLALGGSSRRTLRQGHVWERGSDPGFLDETIAQIAAGSVRSIAVVAPRGVRWPLPAYELALVLAWCAAGTEARVTLITAEEHPLGALGRDATDAVTHELDAAGVETITGAEPVDDLEGDRVSADPTRVVLLPEQPADLAASLVGRPSDPARVSIDGGSRAEFDRLISLPTVQGPNLAGVATDAAGFIEVDRALRVCGSERTWAVGSCIAAALEHSALSAGQADAAIAAIAVDLGVATVDRSIAPELTGMLLTGRRRAWLEENPPGTRQPSTRCLWWPTGRAVGRTLAEQIAARDPSVGAAVPPRPVGVPIRTPIALGCSPAPAKDASPTVGPELRASRLRDIENRQLMAVHRREESADLELRSLDAELRSLAKHQQQAIGELQQHGYLIHHTKPVGRPAH